MDGDTRTQELLQGIWNEMKAVRTELGHRIDMTNERLDQTRGELSRKIAETNKRLDQTREELGRRIVDSEMRTATAITELAGSIQGMTSLLKQGLELRPRVEHCEEQIAQIKDHVGL